jgi:tetratricopeptide (TPR) repeat protein
MYAGGMRFWGVLLIAAKLLYSDPRCVPCHSQQVTSYARTGMGRSISRPVAEAVKRQRFTHSASGTNFASEWRSGKLIHRIARNGQQSSYTADWAIGSGNAGKSYLIRIEDALFQSPVSWYAMRGEWDLSPGFQNDKHPDFYRPVTSDCLFCHAGAVNAREGTVNRYANPPFEPASIGCERCHGDPSAHLVAPSRKSIVNPARLDIERRASVCEQCHLSGEARIPNPGRKFSDYRPGMVLEEVFSVYVKEAYEDAAGLKVVSHSEQMERSDCFLKSNGRMWCGTCHDPHEQSAENAGWYRDKCVQCHESEQASAHEQKAGSGCAGCHMPKAAAYDGGHTAFTDHWIRVGIRVDRQAPGLRAWREPMAPFKRRNLGLAYISAGAKAGDSSQLLRGFQLLSSEQPDGAVQIARGLVLLQSGKIRGAVAEFRQAVEEQPQDSSRRLNLAAALLAAGDRAQARDHAVRAIALEPMLEGAYELLAEIEPARAEYWKDRYRQVFPRRLTR